MSNSYSPELHELTNHKAHTYVFNELSMAVIKHTDPETHVFDYETAEAELSILEDKFFEWGMPADHIRLLTAFALVNMIETRPKIAATSPEHFDA